MLHFFNTQTLALLAVVVGFVVLCLGLWYVWTNQSQLRTEIQLLRSQQPTSNTTSVVPTTNRSHLNSKETKDILAAMGSTSTTDSSLNTAQNTCAEVNNSPNMPDEVVHRSQETYDDEQSGSESSGSEYDDDDEDVTDEDENDQNLAIDKEEPSADLVESLLSSIVTNAIDNSVEMQGGPSAIMNSVETSESNDNTETTDSNADDEIGNESSLQEASNDSGIVQNLEDNDVCEEECEEKLSNDVSLLTEELREHTVPQLKVMCQQHDIGVRRSNGTNKRKEELITDLVQVLSQTNPDEGHETASNESVTAAGV